MPVEALQHSRRQIIIRNAIAASPPRLRPKGPVGPDFFRQSPTTAAAKPKQSAVERLEADKAKYVKSQVALSKQQQQQQQQQQIRPPIARKPPLNPSTPLRPMRKTQPQPTAKPESVQLDLKHLSNLISIGNDGPHPSAAVCSQEKGVLEGSTTITAHDQTTVEAQKKAERPCPPPRPDWASPAKVRLKSTAPTRGDTSGPSGTVRRVDVMPQTNSVRTTCRPPLFFRQPLHPLLLHSKPPFRLVSNLHLCDPRATAGSSPLKPVVAPLKPINPAIPPTAGSPVPPQPPPVFAAFPPPSPAITRLSSSSSRKRPSLTRSKSDVSDRFSRAGTDLERFFNLCGLDPADLPELAGSSSDIVSLARFRSVSAPGSECAGSDRDDEEEEEGEEDAGKAADRVPYGVSVIERNARVIKWLYGLRQAKDGTTKNTNP